MPALYPYVQLADESGTPIDAANPLDTTATITGPVTLTGPLTVEGVSGSPTPVVVGGAGGAPVSVALGGPAEVTGVSGGPVVISPFGGAMDVTSALGVNLRADGALVGAAAPLPVDVPGTLSVVGTGGGLPLPVVGTGGGPVEVTGPSGAAVTVQGTVSVPLPVRTVLEDPFSGSPVATGSEVAHAERVLPVNFGGGEITEAGLVSALRVAPVDPLSGTLYQLAAPQPVQVVGGSGAPMSGALPGAGSGAYALTGVEVYDARAASYLLASGTTGLVPRRVSARGTTAGGGGLTVLSPVLTAWNPWLLGSTLLRVAAGGSALDDPAFQGAHTVQVWGLDGTGARVTDVLTTAGVLAGPDGVTAFRRVERARVNAGGSVAPALQPAGDLVIETVTGGVPILAIATARGRSQAGLVEVAAGEVAYVRSCKVRCTGDTARVLLLSVGSTLNAAPMQGAQALAEAAAVDGSWIEICQDGGPWPGLAVVGPADLAILHEGAAGGGELQAELIVWVTAS